MGGPMARAASVEQHGDKVYRPMLKENLTFDDICGVPGILHEKFAPLLKTVTLHLADHALHRVWKRECYGCQVDHPSQKHHSCLYPIPEDFFQYNFKKIMEDLWNTNFIQAVTGYLHANDVYTTYNRIQGAAELLLHELKDDEDIRNTFEEAYNDVREDWYRLLTLDHAVKTWKEGGPGGDGGSTACELDDPNLVCDCHHEASSVPGAPPESFIPQLKTVVTHVAHRAMKAVWYDDLTQRGEEIGSHHV